MLSAIVKPVFDLCRDGIAAWKRRRNPARAQAQRLLDAFAAHGVTGVQIPRLLPEALALPNAAFADADDLKRELRAGLLDWAATRFAWQRGWLDGVEQQRHLRVDGYKQPAFFRDWLEQRVALPLDGDRTIHVWVASTPPLGPQSTGSLCIAYGERFDHLDAQELSRYWLLSEGWSLNHSPCIENLMALCAIAAELGIWVVGHTASGEALKRLEEGKLFVPQLLALSGHRWFPGDLIDPLPGEDSAWRQSLWDSARSMLESDGVRFCARRVTERA